MSSPTTSDANCTSHLQHVGCAGTRGGAKELAPGRSRNRTGGKHYEGYHREAVLRILKGVGEQVSVVVASWVRVVDGDTAARYILSRKEIELRDIIDMLKLHPLSTCN